MSFKCPNCRANFGNRKAAFEAHINNSPECSKSAKMMIESFSLMKEILAERLTSKPKVQQEQEVE